MKIKREIPSLYQPKVKKPHGCLGGLLAFLFAIFLILSVTLVNLNLTILNSKFWKGWLVENNAYVKMKDYVLPEIFSGLSFQMMPGGGEVPEADDPRGNMVPRVNVRDIDGDDVEDFEKDFQEGSFSGESSPISAEYANKISEALQDAVTVEWLQRQAEGAIDSGFAWLNGKEPLSIELDLSPFIGKFEKVFEEAAAVQFEELPTCEKGTSDDYMKLIVETQCKPAGFSFAEMQKQFEKENPSGIGFGQIPNKYVIDEEQFQKWVAPKQASDMKGSKTPFYLRLLQDPPRVVKLIRIAMYVSIAACVALMILLLVIYRKKLSWQLSIAWKSILSPAVTIFVFSAITYFSIGLLP
ncbi:MAG: hypothetical protein ACD_63C00022G0001, partial [uncultured bacterium]